MTRLQSTRSIRCPGVAALALALAPSLGLAQGTGAAIAAEGRPAMSGAQGGMGTQPGLAQGGLGMQDAPSQVTVPLKRRDHKDQPLATVTTSLPAVTPTVTLAPMDARRKAAKH
ncbi:MAG: hypothetical protein KF796_02015 [Ramlibacter sp.]|nr:hypothetical protein [Ramlibacter sp.]